jgi:hypothetical protein
VATNFILILEKVVATTTVMGRPPLSDEDRRDKPLRIRLTDDERQLLDEAAKAAGCANTSCWARETLEKAAKRLVEADKGRKK